MCAPSTSNAADGQIFLEQAGVKPQPVPIVEAGNSAGAIAGDAGSAAHDAEELTIRSALEEQCQQLFTSALRGRQIEFEHSSYELRTSAFSVIDELIQIAADCPSATITVTGHTDNSGDEHMNQRLSKARADSVVAYMVARGIAAERIQALGAGSSSPISTEDNARARKLNRRIETDILFPQ